MRIKNYLFPNLSLSFSFFSSKPEPSLLLCAIEDTFTILPCTPVSLAVVFILSSRRFVSKKWPDHKSNFVCYIFLNLLAYACRKKTEKNNVALQPFNPNWHSEMRLGWLNVKHGLAWMIRIILTKMIRGELQLNPILGQLERAGHYSCVVSSEKQVAYYYVSETNCTTTVPISRNVQQCFIDGAGIYIKIFRCSWDELKDCAKLRTELRELRSISMTCTFEPGTWSSRLSFTLRPLSSVLAGMITFAPLSARTLAVSFPMPFVAPVFHHMKSISEFLFQRKKRGAFNKSIYRDRIWFAIFCYEHHWHGKNGTEQRETWKQWPCCAVIEGKKRRAPWLANRPVTMAVRWLASTPAVTSSAVDPPSKPDGPRRPHGQPQKPIAVLRLR